MVGSRLLSSLRTRTPRQTSPALVLSAGATRGAFQVGVIDVLARADFVPSLIVGTSVGAINGAYWAFHPVPSAGEDLIAVWLAVSIRRVLPHPQFQRFRPLFDRSGARSQRILAEILRRHLPPDASLEEAAIPLRILATDLRTGEAHVMKEGCALPALLASAAIPGIFPPVAVGDRLLIDGGVLTGCGLEAVAEMGIEDAVVVSCAGLDVAGDAHAMRDVVDRAVHLALRRQFELTLRLYGDRLRVAVAAPRLRSHLPFGELNRTQQLFEMGQAAGRALLDSHLKAGRVRPGWIEGAEPLASLPSAATQPLPTTPA